MASVTELASHLLGLLQTNGKTNGQTNKQAAGNPSTPAHVDRIDAARLAFYHFLKNLCEPGESLTTSVLERFFRRALTHAHWIENKDGLFSEVYACLQHFSNQNHEPLPLPPFASPTEIQVLRAESFRSLERVVEEWVAQNQSPTEQIRLIRDRDEGLIVLRLALDRALTVHLFDRWLALQEGRLAPLADDIALHYTPSLTLDPMHWQQIETAAHTVARFRVNVSADPARPAVNGLAARGFTFQKAAAFDGGDLHVHPALFYPIKRIEQFFVNRATDPLYVELTGLLDKASDLMAQNHPESMRFAEAALERGRLAFEQVFVGDRFLRVQLENLERAVKLERSAGMPVPESTLGHSPLVSSGAMGHKQFLNLEPGQEFIEPLGPDLVELQEAESCETIAPVNRDQR